MKLISVPLSDLKTHPGQPPIRTKDTTELRQSILDHGFNPAFRIKVASDGLTILDGNRRAAALRALLHEGHREYITVTVEQHQIDPLSEEAFVMLRTANMTEAHERTQVLFTAQQMRLHIPGLKLSDALKKLGVSQSDASRFVRLVEYDNKLDGKLIAAVQKHEQGQNGGLSWSAWKEGAAQELGWWKRRLKMADEDDKALSFNRMKAARKAELQQAEATVVSAETPMSVEKALGYIAGAKVNMTSVLLFVQNGATEMECDELMIGLKQLVTVLMNINKVVMK